MKNDN